MNTKHYTSIEQSKKLLELGLSRDTADMVYQYNFLSKSNDTTPRAVNGNLHDTTLRNIPCWSTGALIEMMPKIIETTKEDLPFYFFQSESEWMFQYGYPNETYYSVIRVGSTPLEAAFNMVVWLLENGYIKKESNQ